MFKKIYIILAILLLLTGCKNQYSYSDIESIKESVYNSAYNEGYNNGYDEGHSSGYIEGYDLGVEKGQSAGYFICLDDMCGTNLADYYYDYYMSEDSIDNINISSKDSYFPTEFVETGKLIDSVIVYYNDEKIDGYYMYHYTQCSELNRTYNKIMVHEAVEQKFLPCPLCNPISF